MRFSDQDGKPRPAFRVRWWDARPSLRWRDLGFGLSALIEALPDNGVPADHPEVPYPAEAPPALSGRYWLDARLAPSARNWACLEYSVARGGHLVVYRRNGEPTLQTSSRSPARHLSYLTRHLVSEQSELP